MHAMQKSTGSPVMSPNSNAGLPGWKPPDPPAEALRENAALIAGIAAYRRHPYCRALPDPPTIWHEGNSRVLDYARPDATGLPVLFVPSLVNRAYVLDLAEGASMMRYLAAHGLRVRLLDWGWPGDIERGFGLTDYIAGRLERAVAATAEPLALIGYCMGGLLTTALAQRRPDLVAALGLLATPWDFHAGDAARARALAARLPLLEPLLAFGRTLPVDMLQTLFALLDPDGISRKYSAFGRIDPASPRAKRFVALEDWLNDGIPLAAPVARECLTQWYGANAPARSEWRVAGDVISPQSLDIPAFVAIPAQDRIVPPESARPLGALLRHATILEPKAGHIGMVAGSTAETALWQPLLAWIRGLESTR
jgi:poly(3-hydroxyalkanoate) synthetase